jgi:hypothetical protein
VTKGPKTDLKVETKSHAQKKSRLARKETRQCFFRLLLTVDTVKTVELDEQVGMRVCSVIILELSLSAVSTKDGGHNIPGQEGCCQNPLPSFIHAVVLQVLTHPCQIVSKRNPDLRPHHTHQSIHCTDFLPISLLCSQNAKSTRNTAL